MVQSNTKSCLTSLASYDGKRPPDINAKLRKEVKHVNFETPIRRTTMGAESLRLSRVDVRERQIRFEKMANKPETRKSYLKDRSQSEENHKIKETNEFERHKSESVDKISDLHLKKKIDIVAASSKSKTPGDKPRLVSSSRKQDHTTPKAWVQPLRREPVNDPGFSTSVENFNQYPLKQASQEKSMPVKQNAMPVKQNAIPVRQNAIPVKQNAIPVKQNAIPVKQNAIPVKQNAIPVKQNAIPVKQNAIPVRQNAIPVKQNAIPVKQNAIPVKQNAIPVKQNAIPVKQNAIPVKQNAIPGKTNDKVASGKITNQKSTTHEERQTVKPLQRSKSPSMTISVGRKSSSAAEVERSKTKKPTAMIRVNSKASDKSESKAKIYISSADLSEKSSYEKKNEKSDRSSQIHQGKQERSRNESRSSYYRDVRESLRDRERPSSDTNEFLADIMSLENHEMAKSLGLSEELIQLIKEEEQFWNRQVELKKWRESQENKYSSNLRVFDTEKEKRIAALRREYDARKSLPGADENRQEVDEGEVKMSKARLRARQSIQSESPSEGKQSKIFLKQYSLDEKITGDAKEDRAKKNRYSYPLKQDHEPSRVKNRLSDITSNHTSRTDQHPDVEAASKNIPTLQKVGYCTTEPEHFSRKENGVSHQPSPSREKPRSRSPGSQHSEYEMGHLTSQRSHSSDQGTHYSDNYTRASGHQTNKANVANRKNPKSTESRRPEPRDSSCLYDEGSQTTRHGPPYRKNDSTEGEEQLTRQDARTMNPAAHGSRIPRHHKQDPASTIGQSDMPGLNHLKGERVFSEECDGKVRTYHVTSVAYRYSKPSSSASSMGKSEGLDQTQRMRDLDLVNGYSPPSNGDTKERVHAKSKPKNYSQPTGWFSDDDDVFVNSRNMQRNVTSPRGCFSDDEMAGEYHREKLLEAKPGILQEFYRIRCVGCGCLIRDKNIMSVEGKAMFWHFVCFCCVVCGTDLTQSRSGRGLKVRIVNWKLHCRSCYSTNGDQLTEV